jgi:hypothetical protein
MKKLKKLFILVNFSMKNDFKSAHELKCDATISSAAATTSELI